MFINVYGDDGIYGMGSRDGTYGRSNGVRMRRKYTYGYQ